ncbi:putative nucleolar KKE/D repeat protein DmNOP56 [Operophtera brumata]|uniref:Nucleolar protein 56 n=22 Tax=Obtectomera TaxID=104431 RepID=A0A0L7KU82_OPEBR|nr:putative nucleolar KKE/D repeat protein DmNOP56 [Operophtera brumata]
MPPTVLLECLSKLHVLYEHSAGFALFRVAEFEELAAFLPQVEESVTDLQRFNSVVTLIAFQPFKSAVVALENINAVSEGIVPEDLNLFLEGALPKRKKRGKCAELIKDRKTLSEESVEPLTEILGDSEKAQAIIDASKMSMGMDISPVDLINIQMFAGRVTRSNTPKYGLLYHSTFIGRAGLKNKGRISRYLANKCSIASRIDCFSGAEKALFRALKTRSNTPKYGLLYHSTFIGRAGLKNKGRISRYLANKCSIASRIDCFSVEDRLKFYETGDIPKKNIEVMKEALEEINQSADMVDGTASAKKKKKKKDKKEVAMDLD